MSERSGLNIPIPDPSLLTTEQFNRGQDLQRRELLALRKFLISEMTRIERFTKRSSRVWKSGSLRAKPSAKGALETALKAVTEANDKSEGNFTKQIEANESQTKTITNALNSQVADLKWNGLWEARSKCRVQQLTRPD